MIRNYPTQSIFVDVTIDPDAPTTYKVLDGKQRLSSLIYFCRDEFTTPETLSDLDLAEKYYSELPKEVKTTILSYLFTVETVRNSTAAELNQAFDRLNRNVSRLNKQELRHAQYGGVFITKMEEYAEDDFWRGIGLVTPARIRRMLDVEYVSEFYIITARGIQDGKEYLDQFYSEYDGEIPDSLRIDRKFRRTRRYLEDVDSEFPLAGSRFKNVADFYSLWAAIQDLIGKSALPPVADAATRLEHFQEEIQRAESERAKTYLLAARQGSNKAANREKRTLILEEALTE